MSQCLNSVLNLFANKKLVMEVTCEHMMTSSDYYQRINVVVGNMKDKLFLRLTKKKIKPDKIKTNSI